MPCDDVDPDKRVVWNRPEGGMFLWVRLPQGMDAVELLQPLRRQGCGLCARAWRFLPTIPIRAACACRS
jgi:DNA-binding transcriptional MocR family regulator